MVRADAVTRLITEGVPVNAIVLGQKASYARYRAASELANKVVEQCMADPARHLGDPMTLLCAEFMFKNQPTHQCYWNNRFCIAVMCGLQEDQRRLAAWCAVSNGLNGYWEWRTHSAYDMATMLKYLDIVADDFSAPEKGGMYSTLAGGIAAKLAERFRLPTTNFSMEKRLTEEEHREREAFNRTYPYTRVL